MPTWAIALLFRALVVALGSVCAVAFALAPGTPTLVCCGVVAAANWYGGHLLRELARLPR